MPHPPHLRKIGERLERFTGYARDCGVHVEALVRTDYDGAGFGPADLITLEAGAGATIELT